MHPVFRGSATSLPIKNETTWFLWSTLLNSWSSCSQPCLLPLVLVASFQWKDEQQKPFPYGHRMAFSTSSPLAAAGTFLAGMVFPVPEQGVGQESSHLSLQWRSSLGLLKKLIKAAALFRSVPLFPGLCSWVLLLCWVLCAWEEPQWGGHNKSWNPEVSYPAGVLPFAPGRDMSAPFQQCNPHGFSPKHRTFSILLFPIPPTYTEPKTNWGLIFGWCALKFSVLLPLQNISSALGCVEWSPRSRAVCAVPGAAQQQCLCFVCVWLRVGMCVCVSKVGCLNALLHYVNSSAVQSNSCRN